MERRQGPPRIRLDDLKTRVHVLLLVGALAGTVAGLLAGSIALGYYLADRAWFALWGRSPYALRAHYYEAVSYLWVLVVSSGASYMAVAFARRRIGNAWLTRWTATLFTVELAAFASYFGSIGTGLRTGPWLGVPVGLAAALSCLIAARRPLR